MPPDDQTLPEQEPEDDLRTLLNKAFDEHEPAPDEPPARVRGPDGKFVKAEGDEAGDAPPKPETPETPDKPAPETPETPETPTPAAASAPAHWSTADKEAFTELTPKAQAAWLRRDQEMTADYTRKTQEIAALRRDYEPVQAILAPFEQQIRSKGFTPASLVQAWSNVEVALSDPNRAAGMVRDIINNYGIDKARLARELGITMAAPDGAPPPPEGHQPIILPPEVQRELETLRNGQQQITQHLTAQQQMQQREAEARVMNTIEAFRSAKDDKGVLLHPHFDELEPDMLLLMNAERARGQAPDLNKVYETAVWANTSTREKMLSGQRAAEEAQRVADQKKLAEEARAKAERARKAGSSVIGAPGSGQARIQQSKDGNRSIRDELSAAYDELAEA